LALIAVRLIIPHGLSLISYDDDDDDDDDEPTTTANPSKISAKNF